MFTTPIHSRWIRPDTTLCIAGIRKQAWMTRHIKAQATPTHASGFQLFTVAMTCHAQEWVQLPQQKNSSLNHCYPNAVWGAGAREWDLSKCSRGFACLIERRRGTAPLTGTLDRSPEPDLSRRNGVDNQTQAYATIWCMNMAWGCEVVWANATSNHLVWSPFEPKVQMHLQIKLQYMP